MVDLSSNDNSRMETPRNAVSVEQTQGLRLRRQRSTFERAFRELDMFRKLPLDLRRRQAKQPLGAGGVGAGLIQLAFYLLIGIMMAREIVEYANPKEKQHFVVDQSEYLSSPEPSKLRVRLNVSFHRMPCTALSLDYQDIMGSKVVDVQSTVFKRRLDPQGSPIPSLPDAPNSPSRLLHAENLASGGPAIRKKEGNDTDVSCGSCYGSMPDGSCCDSCADVMYGYRLKRWALPRIEEISQCAHDPKAKEVYQPPQMLAASSFDFDEFSKHFQKLQENGHTGFIPPLQVSQPVVGEKKESQFKPEEWNEMHRVFKEREKEEKEEERKEEEEMVAMIRKDQEDEEEEEEERERGPPRRRLQAVDMSSISSPVMNVFLPVFAHDEMETFHLREQKGEGCQIHGYFDTNKVPGNFHIGLHGVAHEAWEEVYGRGKESLNMEHTIHTLRFVHPELEEEVEQGKGEPLTGFQSPEAFTFQYYLTVFPAARLSPSYSSSPALHLEDSPLKRKVTLEDGYQYKGGSFVTNELVGPAIYFRFDLDPIKVLYVSDEVLISSLLTRILGIVGGCMAFLKIFLQLWENMACGVGGKREEEMDTIRLAE